MRTSSSVDKTQAQPRHLSTRKVVQDFAHTWNPTPSTSRVWEIGAACGTGLGPGNACQRATQNPILQPLEVAVRLEFEVGSGAVEMGIVWMLKELCLGPMK